MSRTKQKRNKNRQEPNPHSELFHYFCKHGVKLSHLTGKTFTETGRGLQIKRNCSSGTRLISIPKHLLITMDTIIESDLYTLLQYSTCKLQPKDLFVLYLITEKRRSNSRWKVYINSLPIKYRTPSFINEEDASCIPEFVREMRSKQILEIGNHYLSITNFAKDLHKLPGAKPKNLKEILEIMKTVNIRKADIRWVWNVINTRSIFFDPKYLKHQDKFQMQPLPNFALAPILDFFNHKDKAQVETAFNISTNAYEIITLDTYKAKQQVFINYGPHSNRVLLEEYGFVLPNNRNTSIPLSETLFQKCFPFQEKYFSKLVDIFGKPSCSIDGLSWCYHEVAHRLSLNQVSIEANFWYQECHRRCDQKCIAYDQTVKLLEHMIAERESDIKKLNSKTSPPVMVVKELLNDELKVLIRTKSNFSSVCHRNS